MLNCGENHQENCVTTTTADCKTFLASQFSFDPKGWKRVSKFNDSEGNPTREFSHPQSQDNIFLVERSGQLALSTNTRPAPKSSSASLAPTSPGSKYVFSLVNDPVATQGIPDTVVLMTRRAYFDKTGYMNDQPDYAPLKFLPPEWEADDINECGTWVIQTALNGDEIIETLHDLGCHSDAKFDALCEGRSALTCQLILNRKLNQTLTEITTNIAPNPAVKSQNKI